MSGAICQMPQRTKKSEEAPIERLTEFGTALKNARGVRQMTQGQLGEALGGVTQSAISAWEAGDYEPSPQLVFAAEQILELGPGHLSRILGYLPLEAAEAPPSFEDAVLNDRTLDEPLQRALLALYRELGVRPIIRGRKSRR